MTLNIIPQKGPEAIRDLLTSPDAVNGNTMDQRIIAAYERERARIATLESALAMIADHGVQRPWGECARIARQALRSSE